MWARAFEQLRFLLGRVRTRLVLTRGPPRDWRLRLRRRPRVRLPAAVERRLPDGRERVPRLAQILVSGSNDQAREE